MKISQFSIILCTLLATKATSVVGSVNKSGATTAASKCPYAEVATVNNSTSPTASKAEFVKEAVFNIIKSKTENEYSVPSRKPSLQEIVSQSIQIRAIQKPGFLRTIAKPFIFKEGYDANHPSYLSYKRAAFGENFCCAGQVVLSNFEDVSKALTNPQARTLRLGTAYMSARHLPGEKGLAFGPKRKIFLLELSQKKAGGDGMHEKVRSALVNHVINGKSINRQNDPIANALMDQLAEDYRSSSLGKDKKFWNSLDMGLTLFFSKYICYCLLGINPNDKQKIEAIWKLFYGNGLVLWYFKGGGIFNIIQKFAISRQFRKVVKIVEGSPSIQAFPENRPEYGNLTRFELAHGMMPLLAIAALTGPNHALNRALGNAPLPEYKETKEKVSKIDVTKFWDELNLDDVNDVDNYLYEVMRLDQPVGHTHRVATEDFTVKMLGRDRNFPKGTIISIPINMCMINKNVWGDDVFQFNHKRANLQKYSMVFHSLGNQHAGRICPGKWLCMNMMRDIVIKLGKVRRE